MAFGDTIHSIGNAFDDLISGSAAAGYAECANLPPVEAIASIVANMIRNGFPTVAIGTAGTPVTQIRVYSQSVTPASVSPATAAEQTFTVTGLTTADKVFMNPAATGNATGVCSCRVTASNTIGITFVNPTAGALTPGSGTYTFVAIRS